MKLLLVGLGTNHKLDFGYDWRNTLLVSVGRQRGHSLAI